MESRLSTPVFLQRLIGVLVEGDRMRDARMVFCEGITFGISSDTLSRLVADDLKNLFTADICNDFNQ